MTPADLGRTLVEIILWSYAAWLYWRVVVWVAERVAEESDAMEADQRYRSAMEDFNRIESERQAATMAAMRKRSIARFSDGQYDNSAFALDEPEQLRMLS